MDRSSLNIRYMISTFPLQSSFNSSELENFWTELCLYSTMIKAAAPPITACTAPRPIVGAPAAGISDVGTPVDVVLDVVADVVAATNLDVEEEDVVKKKSSSDVEDSTSSVSSDSIAVEMVVLTRDVVEVIAKVDVVRLVKESSVEVGSAAPGGITVRVTLAPHSARVDPSGLLCTISSGRSRKKKKHKVRHHDGRFTYQHPTSEQYDPALQLAI